MRDRLIKLFKNFHFKCIEPCEKQKRQSENKIIVNCERCKNEQIADYLLENGVIVPPCKVGGFVYSISDCINRPEKLFVTAIHQYEKYISFSALSRSQRKYVFEEDEIGKTVFHTKEQAEQALKERY